MDDKYTVSPIVKIGSLVIIILGLLTFGIGFYINSERTWANFLLNNYYFLSIAIGATFFLAIQYITQSGWSALFVRIPHALGQFIPVSGILMLLLIFGMHSIYHWSEPSSAINDEIIVHKSPYLNIPFFFIRIIIFYMAWIIMTRLLRKMSYKEDEEGGKKYFYKSELFSKIYIFILAITFSLFTFDLIMSIDVHWFSTIFAVKNFVSGFYHAVAIIVLIVIFLNKKGYFTGLNKSHLHDFSRYVFILSIIWAYLWFVQYLLIWFANIHEETIYFVMRMKGSWKTLFFLNIILNSVIPFFALLLGKLDRNKNVILFVCFSLIIGQWVDLYLQIIPGSVGTLQIGFIEIGSFIGFIGLFVWIVSNALTKLPLIPKNHPYLDESLNHNL